MKWINRAFVLDSICVLYALLFVYAAASKFMDFELFKAQIGKSPLITHHSGWIAWFIPGIEIAISVALFVPRLKLAAIYASFALMFLFTAYIAFLLTFSPYVPCSCGGVLSGMGWTAHLLFNIGFTLLGVLGIYLHNRTYGRQAVAMPSFN